MIQASEIPVSINLTALIGTDISDAETLVRGVWPSIRPFQWAVIWEILRNPSAFDQLRQTNTPHTFNTEHGVRASFGRRSGHSLLARILLTSLPNAILVVPSEEAPFSRKKQAVKMLADAGRLDLEGRIWVSRPVDIIAAIDGEPTRDDVLEKRISPFKDASYCIVDDASFMSQDELRLLRSVSWSRYIELA